MNAAPQREPSKPREPGSQTLLAGLRRLFAIASSDEPPATAPTPEARSRAERASAPVGRFSLVGLLHVRQELGERWPALAERVRHVAETVITRFLLPGDVYEMNDEGDYVVLFCQLSDREAEFKARAIATEITHRLLGSEWGKLSAVEVVSATVPRAAASEDALQAALTASFAKGVRFVSVDPAHAADLPTFAGAGPESPAGGPSASSLDLAGGNVPAPAARPATTSALIGRRPPDWRYTPIWDFKRSALIHFCIVQAEPHDFRQPDADGKPTITGGALHGAVFASDISALKRVSADIIRLAGLDRRLPVTCPLHGGALEYPSLRRELLDVLRDLPLNVRQLLTIEFTAPPAWPTSTAVEQFIAAIRSLKVRVCSRLPASRVVLTALGSLPGPVTIQLPPAGSLPEEACMKYLEVFVDRASRAEIDCGVAGLSTRSMAIAASAAGVRFLSGPIVHGDIVTLDQATRFDLAQLYGDLLPKGRPQEAAGRA